MLSHTIPSSGLRPRHKKSSFLAYGIALLLLAVCGWGMASWLELQPGLELHTGYQWAGFIWHVVLPIFIFFWAVGRMISLRTNARVLSGYQISLDQLQKRLNDQQSFLQAITDHDAEVIAIFDKNNNYWFVNRRAAANLKRGIKEIIGFSPGDLLEADSARQLIMRLDKVRRSGKPIDALEQVKDDKGILHYIQTHYKILPAFNDFSGGIMQREEDVTNLILERERREKMLRQLLATLVAVVDRRDPYAAGHSARVGELSRVIAEELVLSEKDIEATEIAGSLMNFGKVLVSRSLLTKTMPLTPDELQRVRDAILTSAEILSIIDFSGPVVPTLKQVLERYDGTGVPLGLKGDEILITARIVTVANTYVALVSPRAHRPSLGPKEAIAYMMKDVGILYDRAVVKALAHFIENRSNKLDWLTATKQN